MTIKQRLDLRQGQTLAMTPQLQQAIKLLQMSNLELSEFLEAEIEKNPLLERDDGTAGDTAPSADEGREADSENVLEGQATRREDDAFIDRADGDEGRGHEGDFDNVFTGESLAERQMAAQEGGYDAFATNSFADVGKGGSAKFDDPDFSLENTMAETKTLRDHLTAQIQLEFESGADRAIAFVLLDYLDEAGYIRTDLAALAQRLGCELPRVEAVLTQLQGLDPDGIFARNLSECLALQLRMRDRLDPAMEILLQNLDMLAAHDLKKLKALCGVDDDDLRDMIAEIKALHPKPAMMFDHFVSQTVVPDVLMKPLPKSRGGGYAVELNTDTLPRVLVNKTYYTEILKTASGKEDKAYLNEQMGAASWLVKALDQRAQTILKTASAIIEEQEAFFNYGVEYLKPLVLKDVATKVEMHESTISRVTTGKYLGTPRGVFELKYFFSSGVSSSDGATGYAAEAVKAKIKALTDAEDPRKILSDDDIAAALQAEGIDVARRTVAKYREALGVASSVQRRRQKNP